MLIVAGYRLMVNPNVVPTIVTASELIVDVRPATDAGEQAQKLESGFEFDVPRHLVGGDGPNVGPDHRLGRVPVFRVLRLDDGIHLGAGSLSVVVRTDIRQGPGQVLEVLAAEPAELGGQVPAIDPPQPPHPQLAGDHLVAEQVLVRQQVLDCPCPRTQSEWNWAAAAAEGD